MRLVDHYHDADLRSARLDAWNYFVTEPGERSDVREERVDGLVKWLGGTEPGAQGRDSLKAYMAMGRVLNFFVTLDILLEKETLDKEIVGTFFREPYLYWEDLLHLIRKKAKAAMAMRDEWRKPSWLRKELSSLEKVVALRAQS